MKIDAHQHFWKYNPEEYGWISEEMKVLQRNFLPEDLKINLDKLGFDGSVVVQARQTLEETEWLLALADSYSFVKGVVGWVDLCSVKVASQIEKYTSNTGLVGVRHVIHDELDDEFMMRKDFRTGIGKLEKHGLVYDILIFPKHLKYATQLVDEFPNQVFVLDHIAKPLIKEGIISPWDKDIVALAQRPNVYCKLSGMITEADWYSWQPDDFKNYLDTVFQAFGTKRLMIGSDWPVCTVAGDYETVMGIVMDYVSALSKDEQANVLGGNCNRCYSLK